jgi:hypothetical protein
MLDDVELPQHLSILQHRRASDHTVDELLDGIIDQLDPEAS